jgi:hypothetical protein
MKRVFGIAVGVTAAVVAVGVALTPVPEPAVVTADPQQPGSALARPATGAYTLVIGDSIAHGSSEELGQLQPHWIIDAVDGRTVDKLPAIIEEWVERTGSEPAEVVVELGTNTSRAWQPEDYRAVRDLLPASRIAFVTPYRAVQAGNRGADPSRAIARTGSYAAEMRRLAAAEAGTCIAEWRDLVAADPALLDDGVHPTSAAERVWAELVSEAMHGCRSELS